MSSADPYARLAGVYDEIVVDPSYGRMARFMQDLWADDPAGVEAVLDVCCGTGLLAAELAALGHRVTGVDASEAMLARARSLLGPDAALERRTLPDLAIAGTFDAAVSTVEGLNHIGLPDLRATLLALAGRLRPGGWLVFDAHTDAMLAFTAANPRVEGAARGWRFVITHAVDPRARTCDSRIEASREDGTEAFTESHRQWFFTESEIRDALSDAGFRVVEVDDDYERRPAGTSTLRAVWVARRPDV